MKSDYLAVIFRGKIMTFCRSILIAFVALLPVSLLHAASVHSYLPENTTYDPAIILPESILDFDVGDRHVRHDQLQAYFQALAESSKRIKLTEMGTTNELRKQLLVTFSSEENLANLASLLKPRRFENLDTRTVADDAPLVIWLGYSVHGDEISGANAAMVVAYHLAASQSKELDELLANTVIVLEPSMNPDGMDRFVNWANTFRNSTANSSPDHIEHHQPWRTGRTNHFGFDLNRDWLLLTQKETLNRVPYFYQYQPNVVGDFHEMSAKSSYFFQPGIPTRNNPLTPQENISLTAEIAKHHAASFDQRQQLYYSQESFDDFYYGKGSTYPDITGAVGILFEQAGTRGMQQDTDNGVLTFAQGIQNHVLTSLSTIEGAWHNKKQLQSYRQQFYQQVEQLVDDKDFHGYLVSEAQDQYRLNALLEKLQQHQIKAYPLTSDFRFNKQKFPHQSSYYVPLNQPQYRIIQTLFGQQTRFADNSFYDVSGWTIPLAMDLNVEKISSTRGLKLAKQTWQKNASQTAEKTIAFDESAYAYAFEWHHYLAPKLLQSLLNEKIKMKVATKPFSAAIGSETIGSEIKHDFVAGTIVIPAGIQQVANWQTIIKQASDKYAIELSSLASGLSMAGVDLGSNSLKAIKPVNILLVGGKSVSQYEAAEVLFYLDEQLNIPVTIVEKGRLGRVDLNDYSHIIVVDGDYSDFAEKTLTSMEVWLKQGGVVIAQKRGAKWLAEKDILKANFVSDSQIADMFDTEGLNYQDKAALASRKRISGAIYQTRLDSSHPLSYGFNDEFLPLFRNSTLIMDMPTKPFVTVAQYTEQPLLSGYSDKNLVNRIANNAAVIAHNVGKGRVIATSDNLTFRGYWQGSARLLSNSLFFAHTFSATVN